MIHLQIGIPLCVLKASEGKLEAGATRGHYYYFLCSIASIDKQYKFVRQLTSALFFIDKQFAMNQRKAMLGTFRNEINLSNADN